jgi:hypothetical protein
MSIPLVQLGGLPALSEKYLPDTAKLGVCINGRFHIEIPDGFNPVTLEQAFALFAGYDVFAQKIPKSFWRSAIPTCVNRLTVLPIGIMMKIAAEYEQDMVRKI